jgi:hypothetical protein
MPKRLTSLVCSWPPLVTWLFAVWVALVAAPARASDNPWFFAELHSGVAVPSGLPERTAGYVGRLMFGAGGRVAQSPFRLFGIVSAGSSWHFTDGVSAGRLPVSLRRAIVDYGVGGRLLVAFSPMVRLYGDLQIGYGHVISTTEVGSFERYESEAGQFALMSGVGLQLRFTSWLSVAARYDWTGVFVGQRVEFASEVAGLGSPSENAWGRHAFSLTLGFHF